MPSGRLQIAAFSQDVGRPAEGALVRVLSAQEGRVVEELVTDASGQTPAIDLPAPPPEYSLAGGGMPYRQYDLEVYSEGYAPLRVEGVQIIPDATAFQDLRLSPALQPGLPPRVIEIRPHTLWGSFPPKVTEPEVKELPPALGYIVLPDPVVPEFIIVHDGAPTNSAAPNYWVPFADYIKNVASCEIFPNWPQETLRANVLAILSFTLNRVYTEWYRGKGYDFTITSSTAYDHAFSYGRNSFKEISVVVDEIFTTFLTRTGARQPLLAQYCDGRSVLCPGWMTQWGSKDLGDRGYSAMEILKSFYGQDIYLMQAQRVAGVPRSYGGTALQMGSAGEAVRVVQTQLNAVAGHYPAIPLIRVDGVFGDQTRQAVEQFQRIFRLSADGIVGFATWYRLSHIYVAVTRMAELN